MRLTGTAQRLTIIVGDSDHWHHRPLFTEIVHRAHAAGLAGATVLHDVEGFGATSRIHTSRLTTYSTFSYETLRLLEDDARLFAAANVVASIVAGLGAAFLGVAISRAIWS